MADEDRPITSSGNLTQITVKRGPDSGNVLFTVNATTDDLQRPGYKLEYRTLRISGVNLKSSSPEDTYEFELTPDFRIEIDS